MVIAVDFDETLSEYKVQEFIGRMKRAGNDIWVVTKRRTGQHNKDLFKIVDKLGISRLKVIYTDEKPKLEFLEIVNADLFIDNSFDEFSVINNNCKTLALGYFKH